MWFPKTLPSFRRHRPVDASVVTPAHKVKLGVIATGATSMRVSALINDVTHEKWFLSQPLTSSGAFSRHRIAVNAHHRAFAVKEVFTANASAHHKALTTRQALLHERASMVQAHSPLAFVETLEEEDRIYCLMPLLDGDLYDVIVGRAWTPHNALLLCAQVMAQVGRQLDRAHRHGVVHEDVKPENILWRKDGKLLLADFGAARDLVRDTERAAEFSIPYAAPERLAKQDSGLPADVWSLGIVLLQILTRGKNPLTPKEPDDTTALENWDLVKAMRRKQRTFARWQQFSSKEPLLQNFHARFKLDFPKVAEFIVRRMLCADPKERAKAIDVAHFGDRLAPLGGHLRLRPFLRQSAKTTTAVKVVAQTLDVLKDLADHRAVPQPPPLPAETLAAVAALDPIIATP